MKSTIISLIAAGLLVSACTEKSIVNSERLDQRVVAALNATIEDEYLARMTYEKILSDFGDNTMPFVNIKKAEIKHAESLATVMERYGVNVPTNELKVEEMPTFSNVKDACAAGVIAEIANIELYDSYLALDLPADVRTVFTNNRAASENMHLPAFQNCSK